MLENIAKLSEDGWNALRDALEAVASRAIQAGEYDDAVATMNILMDLRAQRVGP
jgi:hypothetical protein